ncbi:MAG: DUF1189 domain-containing protein [Gammaproteobacteria bacterium]|nr:DUF1189 domain-containing protein [Gammaproteobacteria bacterium]
MESSKQPISVLKALGLVFYSMRFYRNLGTVWSRRRVMGFLLLFLVITWLIGSVGQGVFSYQRYSNMIKQVPLITVKAGRVSTTSTSQPLFIRDPANKKVFAVIDTTDRYKQFASSDASYLISSNGYKYKYFDLQTRREAVSAVMFPATTNFIANHAFLSKQLRIMLWSTVMQHFFSGMLSSFVFTLISAALYAFVLRLFATLVARKLHYGTAFNLAVVAISPGVGLIIILFSWDILFSLAWLVALLIHLAYLFLAARAQPLPEKMVDDANANTNAESPSTP